MMDVSGVLVRYTAHTFDLNDQWDTNKIKHALAGRSALISHVKMRQALTIYITP